ncbi:16S rRNA (uracil(1498)-N(3))-methyltransferase [Dactylosporangium matsuzakiense]|uniref:Ribosomal RNA small subunit methyltransferase E n=1 Tax=Dactylosporangium matsuzakiense TaxID=53360 RepID=A0A9W6NR01_9ACTN|nr:16S rRNA (uracil(1498)-N(3))-methyltransferase [Dactylosporangium matsuzakiense]UWZ43735.1 16S rRNA (uracil(1498)-N(3))-methyltransferase [Dactylosporangium matsuzakiense]GLL05771.1 ribosomal RNA small subunit methyltransferase E [Dactylosporangium matsuzakiense]
MSLPLFLVPSLPAGPSFVLDGPEGHHAADVQRLTPGEALLLADGRGGVVRGVVVSARKGSLALELDPPAFEPERDPSLTVVQGIAKGERAELAVQLLTEVGVDRIVPWQAARCVARWKDDRPLERWRSTVREAAKQSRRPRVPTVSPAATTKQLSLAGVILVLHEEASVPLSAVPLPAAGEITLVVGPEGGVAPEELDMIGGTPVRLGREVLRTSTAGAAAVAALSIRLGRW